jgi:hypothetical protein
MFNIFLEVIFVKYFKGRNVIIKNHDLRFLIKNTINISGVKVYLEKLLKFVSNKETGGARTAHQINQVKIVKLGFQSNGLLLRNLY